MEEEGKNTSEAWGLPISNVDTFSNLTDSQFLVRVLGPKHMGYEVIWAKYFMGSELQKVPQSIKQGAGAKSHGIYRVIYILPAGPRVSVTGAGKIFTKLCLAFELCGSRMHVNE